MKKVILDVDTGIDDALAIAYAVNSPEIEVIGITTSHGNIGINSTTRNTLQVLELLEKKIPVYKGASKPLVLRQEFHTATDVHGADGLGNTFLPEPVLTAEDMPASEFILQAANMYGKDLTLITTAALTNLAVVLEKEPDFSRQIGHVVIMGGAVAAPGNVTKFAEANIYADPHAAEKVFQSSLPITLIGLDVTMKTVLPRESIETWRQQEDKVHTFLADISSHYLTFYSERYPFLNGCALHDPLAVGAVTHPGLIHTHPMFLKVDLEDHAIGETVEDLSRIKSKEPNVKVGFGVDADKFLQLFMERV
ncbi:nucleoside hydrolase [Bacillus massiliglaciei]|uniref:nucleoside hydrolase n=1 Tax=Bacillus massiliglaciei TaxID=1816693 RepID=UPI000A41E534|nr:nucleoside hydrolase [Bacillus massiliglaciei]